MPTAPTIWFVNATRDFSALPALCRQARAAGQLIHVLHHPRDRQAISHQSPPGDKLIHLVEIAQDDTLPFHDPLIADDAEIFFLPCSAQIDLTALQQLLPLTARHCIQPMVPEPPEISDVNYVTTPITHFGWRAGGDLARRILCQPSAWDANAINLLETLQHWPAPPRWQSIPLRVPGSDRYPLSSPPCLTTRSSVLAVLSFYRCEEWLHAALTSMAHQTRPPENIVLIDDCSPALPLKFLEPFPNVTLLSTTRNIGPEKILNNIIKSTGYDAYMVQDPDDFSAHDRLEISLLGAEQSGADLVGTQEICVNHRNNALELCVYPPDVNHAMSVGCGHHLLQTASLISRALAMKIGGFDENLRLGADTDFISRAWHAGRLINLPSFCAFHRVRAGSLTTGEATGYQSPARMLESRFINIRAKRRLDMLRAGQKPDVFVHQKEPVEFIHHRGPTLCPAPSAGA